MIEFLHTLFGEYTPPTYEVTYLAGSDVVTSTVIPAGAAGVDWQYIACVVVFCVFLYCFMRILGGVLCRIS